MTITIDSSNDAPVATPQSATTNEDTPLPIALGGTDADGDALTFAIVSPPAHGTYSAGTYTPARELSRRRLVHVHGERRRRNSLAATVTITIKPLNDAPVATPQSVATNEDTPLAIDLAGTDVDGDALTFTIVTPPAHGTFAGGTYTPSADYNGPDSFTFTANDGAVDSAPATITIS